MYYFDEYKPYYLTLTIFSDLQIGKNDYYPIYYFDNLNQLLLFQNNFHNHYQLLMFHFLHPKLFLSTHQFCLDKSFLEHIIDIPFMNNQVIPQF